MKDLDPSEAAAGLLVRSGIFAVRSRFTDYTGDNDEVLTYFDWHYRLEQDWE